MKRIQIVFLVTLFIFSMYAYADVPYPRLHKPDVPYLYQSMNFQTIEMRIFSPNTAGMVPDAYSDCIWNPAYLLGSRRSVYLDFYTLSDASLYAAPSYIGRDDYYSGVDLTADWVGQSSVQSLQATPHYHFAITLPLGKKWTAALINRSLFDYGPYRAAVVYPEGGYATADAGYRNDYEIQRMETDDNQQKVWGTQSELLLAYALSKKVNLGFRLGQYIYNHNGDLYDSKWAVYPHNSDANLNDESMSIDGHHYEFGLGLLYQMNPGTRIGLYGSYLFGKSGESAVLLDTSDYWWERDTNPAYYTITDYLFESEDAYNTDGNRPKFTVTFETKLKPKLQLRSFFSGTWTSLDIDGSVSSSDTSYSDRTYDDREWSTMHFRRQESHSSRMYRLSGTGEEKTHLLKWFVSFIYQPKNIWTVFGGLQFQKYGYEQSMTESAWYHSHGWTEYTYYDPGTVKNLNTYELSYDYGSKYSEWRVTLPVGIQAEIKKGLSVLLGLDLNLSYVHTESEAEQLYPEVIDRRWEDGRQIVNDVQINRYEVFTSNPADVFNRNLYNRFGLVYRHKSGAKFYLRSYGNITETGNWTFGFQYCW